MITNTRPSGMKVLPVMIRATGRSYFRCGVAARIAGVRMVTPDYAHSTRLCYVVEFEDGVVDYFPVS